MSDENNINLLKNAIIKVLAPIKMYLFGSFSDKSNTDQSDYDFYVIVDDNTKERMVDLTFKAYKAIRHIKTRPVDIIVKKSSDFEQKKDNVLSVENDVINRGVLIYG